jgi:hypothetical protein
LQKYYFYGSIFLMSQKQMQSELAPMPGDDFVPDANVVSDAGTVIDAPIDVVYGYLAQMGRRDDENEEGEGRGGWPLPASIEGRFIPEDRQALRDIDPLKVKPLEEGAEMGDWLAFGKRIVAKVVEADGSNTLVFTSGRGKTDLSWALHLSEREDGKTELRTRLRLNNIKHEKALSKMMFVDQLLIEGLGKGIEERHRGIVPEQKQKATKLKAAAILGGLVASAYVVSKVARRRRSKS